MRIDGAVLPFLRSLYAVVYQEGRSAQDIGIVCGTRLLFEHVVNRCRWLFLYNSMYNYAWMKEKKWGKWKVNSVFCSTLGCKIPSISPSLFHCPVLWQAALPQTGGAWDELEQSSALPVWWNRIAAPPAPGAQCWETRHLLETVLRCPHVQRTVTRWGHQQSNIVIDTWRLCWAQAPSHPVCGTLSCSQRTPAAPFRPFWGTEYPILVSQVSPALLLGHIFNWSQEERSSGECDVSCVCLLQVQPPRQPELRRPAVQPGRQEGSALPVPGDGEEGQHREGEQHSRLRSWGMCPAVVSEN